MNTDAGSKTSDMTLPPKQADISFKTYVEAWQLNKQLILTSRYETFLMQTFICPAALVTMGSKQASIRRANWPGIKPKAPGQHLTVRRAGVLVALAGRNSGECAWLT